MTALKTYGFGPVSGNKAQQLVILLHGLGADGRDLLGLAPVFGQSLPDAVFVAPNAPYPCDMAPMGYQWFSLQDWTPAKVLQGVQNAAAILDNYITEQMEKHGVPPERTALVGFSQGTMMSLYVGPRYPEKLAGVLGYSGAVVWEATTDYGALHKIPVHLIHGDADSVLPVQAYHDARVILEKAGLPLTGGITPGLMHNIDEKGLEDGAEFLRRILHADKARATGS
jgi:phospholipase/carboxylesterase